MQEIINKIYERMEFCANAHTNCQAEEQAYISELSCPVNEVLDQIEGISLGSFRCMNVEVRTESELKELQDNLMADL